MSHLTYSGLVEKEGHWIQLTDMGQEAIQTGKKPVHKTGRIRTYTLQDFLSFIPDFSFSQYNQDFSILECIREEIPNKNPELIPSLNQQLFEGDNSQGYVYHVRRKPEACYLSYHTIPVAINWKEYDTQEISVSYNGFTDETLTRLVNHPDNNRMKESFIHKLRYQELISTQTNSITYEHFCDFEDLWDWTFAILRQYAPFANSQKAFDYITTQITSLQLIDQHPDFNYPIIWHNVVSSGY